MSVRSTGNRGGGDCSGFLLAQVVSSEKAQPPCSCDKSRLVATTLMAQPWHIPITCSFSWLAFSSPDTCRVLGPDFQGRVSLVASPLQSLMLWEWRLHRKPWHSNHSFPCGLVVGIIPGKPTTTLGKFYHTASTQNLPLTKACSSQHTASLAPAASRELEQVPKTTFVAIENVLERTRCCIIMFSSLRTCLQN